LLDNADPAQGALNWTKHSDDLQSGCEENRLLLIGIFQSHEDLLDDNILDIFSDSFFYLIFDQLVNSDKSAKPDIFAHMLQ
jgi:hypothetical protein